MNINYINILKNNICFYRNLVFFIRVGIVSFLVVVVLSCSSEKSSKNKLNKKSDNDEAVTANFNEALGDLLEDAADAVDVEIDPDHFDYEKAAVSLSFTAKNSLFDRFSVGIKFVQLVNTEGYVFTLYDYNQTRHSIAVDFSQLNKQSQLLLYQENVPVGGYQFLVIEFDFTNVDIKAWVGQQLQNIYLISDDARTFSIDQFSYRVSVDLSTSPLILASDAYQHINVDLDLDQSILKIKPLDNSLPSGMPSSAMIFHPSLDVDLSMDARQFFIDGKFQSINDRNIQFIPLGFLHTERYQSYFKPLQFFINDITRFYINNKHHDLDQSNILLAPKNDGFVRLKGAIKVGDDKQNFVIDEFIYADTNDFDKHRIGRIHSVKGSTVTLSSRLFDLEKYTETSTLGDMSLPEIAEVHTMSSLSESRPVNGFMVPFQKLSVLSNEQTILPILYLHPGYVSGTVKSISEDVITLDIVSINHLSRPDFKHPSTIAIALTERGALSIGDSAVFTGYFYNDQFLALSFRKYPGNNASLMIWLDEMPPNEALTTIFNNKKTLTSIDLTENITKKSTVTYKHHDYFSPNAAEHVSKILLDDTQQYFLESYTTLNPHISKFNTLEELLSATSALLEEGGKVYSILYRGKLSGSELLADVDHTNYLKVRFRGRWIDSELARSIFDDDYHGEKRLGGLTLEQIGVITGSVAALLLIEYILEKNKLGPMSQLRAPDFCKPSKKGKTGGKPDGSSSSASAMKQKLSSAASAIGSIGGIAQCLKKLASFSDSEMDLYKYGKQINPEALSLDSGSNKYSSLVVLGNKKLSKKGIEAFRTPEGQDKLNKILDASQNLKKVFDKKSGALGTLRTSAREAAFNLKVDLNLQSRQDNDLFTRLTDLDITIQKPILDMINRGDAQQDQQAVKKMIIELSNLQDKKATTLTDMQKVVNDAQLSIDINIDDDKLSARPVSPATLHESNINSLRNLEKRYAMFQLDDSDKNKEKLLAAMGVTSIEGSVNNEQVEDAINNYRNSIYDNDANINTAQARVLDTLYNKNYFNGDGFHDAKTAQLLDRRLGEIMREKIIEAAMDGKKVSTAELTKEFKQARKNLLESSVKVQIGTPESSGIDVNKIDSTPKNVDTSNNAVDRLNLDVNEGRRFDINSMQNNKAIKGKSKR